MKIFISWSKARSRETARFLKGWLKQVLPDVEPWMSDEDLAKGERLSVELRKGLEGARFGILCMTVENYQEPWVIFEAGAIANAVVANTVIDTSSSDDLHRGKDEIRSRVCPFFIDVDLASKDLPSPLADFIYAKAHDEKDTRKLLDSINGTLDPECRTEEKDLDERFKSMWPSLDEHLQKIREKAPPKPKKPSEIIADYRKIVNEFDHVRRSLELQRKLLARELYPLIINTVMNYCRDKKEPDLDKIADKAQEAVERVREDFNYDTVLIGNGREFLRTQFPPEQLTNIIERSLAPILMRPNCEEDEPAQITVRIVDLIERAELESVNAFYSFYQSIADRLADSLLQERSGAQ